MTQFTINKRTSALKTDLNIFTRISRIETGFCHANFGVKADRKVYYTRFLHIPTWTLATPLNSKSQKAKTELYSLITVNLSDEWHWQRLLVKSFGKFISIVAVTTNSLYFCLHRGSQIKAFFSLKPILTLFIRIRCECVSEYLDCWVAIYELIFPSISQPRPDHSTGNFMPYSLR